MNDYGHLKPGLYVQAGKSIKNLSLINPEAWAGILDSNITDQTPERLASEVSWVFIATEARKEQILEVPDAWQVRGNELESADDLPFDCDWWSLQQQIDKAVQLGGVAYLFKVRNGSGGRGRVLALRWLDPLSMVPDYDNLDDDGRLMQYERHLANGRRIRIPADDVIRIMSPGQRELRPDTSAGLATRRAAQILAAIEQTADTVYDNNGLPVTIINVPQHTTADEVKRIEGRFMRFLNRGKGTRENRAMGVREGVGINVVSFKPGDLAMTDLTEEQVNAILAAHRVPRSIIFEDANYATAQDKRRAFVGTMGTRKELMARTINRDPDMQALGVELKVMTEQHWAMKRDEADLSLALTRYSTVMRPEAAGYLLGITEDDFPDEFAGLVWLDEPIGASSDDSGAGDVGGGGFEAPDEGGDIKSQRVDQELNRLRRFLVNNPERPFSSDILPGHVVDAERQAYKAAEQQRAFTDALARYEAILDGQDDGATD